MTPGPSEEVGKVALSVIEALRTQPSMLMLIVFNVLFLCAIAWAVHEQRGYQHEIMKTMLENCASQRGSK